MARQLLRFGCVLSTLTASLAIPLHKRWNQDDIFGGKHPLQGVEVNGLFNPIESVTPHLFERASEEHGNKLKTYRDICKLLPQEKLNSLMADHYSSFITDFDFETLKSAHIDSLRIPVSYNLFIPEVNRTDAHPKGEARALGVFIDRVLNHGMTVWLDLIAAPTNQLGTLEQFGNTVTADVARRVLRYISKKYHPQDVTTVLVHPDIHFPSTPAKETPLNAKSVRKTKNSQYALYRELSSILDRSGHLLAIDTTHDLDWWASKIPSFSHPVVLVHSLQTGLLSPHQYTVERLKKGIREDLNHVKQLAENVPVVVTWDASINTCARTEHGTHDCTLNGQLWHAADREPEQKENEETLNDYIEDFGSTILMELDKAGVAAWFFRTAKLEPLDYPGRSDLDEQPLKLIKRRRPEQAVSGNDFIAMYNHGMMSKISPTPAKRKHKIEPVALTLGTVGAVGAGALGWMFWDDIKKFGGDTINWFHRPKETPVEEIKSPLLRISGASDSRSQSSAPLSPVLSPDRPTSPSAESSRSLILSTHEIEHPLPPMPDIDHSLHSVWQDQPPIPAVDLNFPLPEIRPPVGNDGQGAPAFPAEGSVAESMAIPPEEGPYGGPVGDPFGGYPASEVERPAQGSIDHTELRPVNEMIQHWETPPPASEPSAERVEISDQGSVSVSVARWETPQGSRVMTPASSRRHSGSEFQLSRGMSAKDAEKIRRLSDIQRDLQANGIPEQEWTPGIAVPRPRRPNSGVDVGNKRHGKVLSGVEQGLLDQMLLESMREEAKAESSHEIGPEGPTGQPISGKGKAAGYSKSDAGIEIEHDVKPAADAALEKAPSVPRFYKSSNSKEPDRLGRERLWDPEPLTHPQQELYTRPHAGTGESSLGVTMSLAKLRKETDNQRRPKSEPQPSPHTGHHVIADGKSRPMTVHAPRIEDLDPNHPKNLDKMKSKSEKKTSEYKPRPAPEFKSHHVEETKVVSKSKGPFSLPKTITTHRRESTHLHPDMATALKQAGHEIPPPPQSGIGKDPRPKFEDLHWTKEEREGHQAYVENVRKGLGNAEEEEEEEPRRSVGELKDFWTNKERLDSPQTTPSAKPKVGAATGQRTSVGEMPSQQSNKNEIESKKSEPSIKSGEEGVETESRRVSVHEMANFWTDKERKETSEAQRVPAGISEARKSAIADRLKAFKEPKIEPLVTTNSLDKEDRRPPPSQPISERVKAFGEATAEKAPEDSVDKEDRIPPPSAPIGEHVKTFEEPPKESKEEPLRNEDRIPPSAAPIADRVKTFEEPTEPKKERTAIEKDLDQAIDTSIAHRLAALEESSHAQLPESEDALKKLQETTQKPVQQRIDELAAELLQEGGEAGGKEPDTGTSRIDPDTKEGPKLTHLTKNRARRPAKKTKPSGS